MTEEIITAWVEARQRDNYRHCTRTQTVREMECVGHNTRRASPEIMRDGKTYPTGQTERETLQGKKKRLQPEQVRDMCSSK